ncbi:MAG: S41 family peptidase [Anaerolineae bacterium]|jgi:carboxyl-terminal processing protease
MDRTLRAVVNFVVVSIAVLTLTAGTFAAGFGSAYLLTSQGQGLLSWLGAAPSPTVSPSPHPESSEGGPVVEPIAEPTDEPTATPIPIPTPTNETEETFQLFWEVWDLVQRHYYDDLPSMREITYAAIRGMLGALGDSYTALVEPDVAAVLTENASGQFEGIGAFVDMDESGTLRIVDTFENGPAEEAGLRADDRVIAVDGESIVGVPLYEAIGRIRGPAGSEVRLTVEREGTLEPFDVVVTRARLDIEIVETEMRDDGIGYIRLWQFTATATDRLEQGLEELLRQDPQGIVLDLRQNPGGWLDQAIAVADLFLGEGLVAVERFSDGSEREFKAGSGDIAEDIPLVVLVNNGSASASEIVAGALQDQERAPLVGVPTFGKGSVQRPFALSDGSELRVTVALWFTPNDQRIQGQGLTPDIEVPWSEEEREEDPEQDPQLQRAVEYLLEGE